MRLFSTAFGLVAITAAAGPAIAAKSPAPVQGRAVPLARSQGTLIPRQDTLNEHGRVVPIPTHWPGPGVYLIPTHWRSRDILVHGGQQTGHLAARAKAPVQNSAAHPLVIGKAQDRHTVTVRTGQYLELQLQSDLTWKVEPVDAKILKAVRPAAGQAEFEAVTPGTTTLKAYGRMKAKPGQMTAMFVILYQVTIQVKK